MHVAETWEREGKIARIIIRHDDVTDQREDPLF